MRSKFINFILTALLAVSVATLPSCSSLAVGAEDVSGQVTAAVMPQDVGGLLGALVAERSGSTSADDDTSAPEETTGESADDSVAADDMVTTDNDTAADSTTSDDEPTADETTGETETTPPETDDTIGVQPKTTADTAASETTAEEPAPKTKQPYKSGDKVVYLTFDDGPHKKNTERILKILDDYGVKATFFVIGNRVSVYPDQLKAVRDAGHAIGCHSYDHVYKTLTTPDGVKTEIADWESAAKKALGEVPSEKLFRFPGGSPTKDTAGCKAAVAELGYTGYDWNCLDNDCLIRKCPKDTDVEEWMKQSFISTYKYGSSLKNAPLIVLAHETYDETVDILGWMIEYLQNEGYTFGTLDTLESWYY